MTLTVYDTVEGQGTRLGKLYTKVPADISSSIYIAQSFVANSTEL